MARLRGSLPICFCLCLLFGLNIILSNPLRVSAQADACSDSLPPRLTVGAMGRVTLGNSNNIRDEASKTGKLIGQIPGGETFDVLAGPTCADGLNWWQVRYGDLEGWTVEAAGIDYWLEPYDPNTPQILAPTRGLHYDYQGIGFILDPALAAQVSVLQLQPVEDDPRSDFTEPVAPAGLKLTFTAANGETLPVSIRIYPVADFPSGMGIEGHVAELHKSLTESRDWSVPPLTQDLPLLATREALLMMRARTAKLKFSNGSGYRFLAQYSYDVHEIINPLEYYFTGLTYDQRYYIVANAEVKTSLLADKVSNSGADFDRNFESYRADVVDQLNKAKTTDFSIDLSLLDYLIGSLEVDGPEFKVAFEGGTTHVHYKNFKFDFESGPDADVAYRIDLASWETMTPLPEHVCFFIHANLADQSRSVTGTKLCLIPTEGMDWYVKDLTPYLKDKPPLTTADELTYIPTPVGGIAKLIYAQVRYLDTDSLQGVRFLTSYAQMDYPIGGKDLWYNFSGLTRGGSYILFLEESANTDVLPDANHSNAQMATINANPVKYYQRIIDKLNPASPADFEPNLDTLDAIIKSIRFN